MNLATAAKKNEILRRCAPQNDRLRRMGDDYEDGLGGGGHLLFLSYPLTDISTHGAVCVDAVLPNPAH